MQIKFKKKKLFLNKSNMSFQVVFNLWENKNGLKYLCMELKFEYFITI